MNANKRSRAESKNALINLGYFRGYLGYIFDRQDAESAKKDNSKRVIISVSVCWQTKGSQIMDEQDQSKPNIEIQGNVSASGPTNIGGTQNIYHQIPAPLPIEGLDERRGRADLALLSRLWKLINSDYIQKLDFETQTEMIHSRTYYAHIVEYLKQRDKAQNKFHHPELEKAFSAFDDVLIRFDRHMSNTYTYTLIGDKSMTLDERGWIVSAKKEARLDHRWLDKETYIFIQERYDELVELSISLFEQSNLLTLAIRSVVPDFFINE